jgi:hypothetical protein
MSGLGDNIKPLGSAVHGDTNEGPTFGTIIMATVSFLSGRFPGGFVHEHKFYEMGLVYVTKPT